MAAVTGAVIGGLSLADSIYQGQQNANAAKNASKQASQAAANSLAAQQKNLATTSQNLSPYIGAGTGALGQLAAVNSGDYSGFDQSPDYLYALDQGLKGVDRSAAARGTLYSGGTGVDLLKAAEGLASQNLGNYRTSLLQQAGMGQSAATNLGQIGAGNANSVTGINQANTRMQTTAGYNQAAGNINTANNVGGVLGQLWGQYGGSIMPNGAAANGSSYTISPVQNSLTTGNYTGPGSLSTTVTAPPYLAMA